MLYKQDMGESSAAEEGGLPERLVECLAGRLQRHVLWDSLLPLFPPLLVFCLLMIFLYQSAWLTRATLIFAGATVMGAALLVGYFRLRAVTPSPRVAAHLIDERVGGKDRFITLATIQPSVCPPLLLDRLRHEAAGLMHRLDPEKDFPYRVKRPFLQSLIGSLSVVLVALLFQQIGSIFAPGAPPEEKLARWAQELSQVPRFSELARNLEALATRLRKRPLADAEKRSLIEEALRRVENQRAAEQQLGGAANDLLNQAANTLRALEQGLEKGQERGAGEQGSKGEGGAKEQGSGGEGEKEGKLSALGSKELHKVQPEAKEKQQTGKKLVEKNQAGAEKDGKEREKSGEVKGAEKEGVGGRGSKNTREEIPGGKAPERFLQPGEKGEKGIKGARFVTVELPEEEAGSSASEGGSGKRRERRPKVPISNVPLRQPDSPHASPEKQPMPLEYRGLIR